MLQTTIALGEYTASDSECAGSHSELKVAAPVGMPNLYVTGRSRGGQCGKAGEDEFHRSAQDQKPRPRHLLAETKRWTM